MKKTRRFRPAPERRGGIVVKLSVILLTCDRERFAAVDGPVVTVPAGGILVVDIDEAFRVLPEPGSHAVMTHVTVEGYSFPNK